MEKYYQQELIAFGMHLTGHDEDTVNQMYEDFDKARAINCLEAKPKALHSMKCDENICSCDWEIPRGGYGEGDGYCGYCGKRYE